MIESEKPHDIRVVREELFIDFEMSAENAQELALSYLASWRSRFGDSYDIPPQEYPALMRVGARYHISSTRPEVFSLTYVSPEDESVRYDFANGKLIVDGNEDSGITRDPEITQHHWDVLSGALYDCDASEKERQMPR